MRKRLLPLIIILLMLLLVFISGCGNKEIPVERIAITSLPKLDYLKGETFDLNNAMVTVYYSNGKTESFPLTFEMVSEYNPQEIGEHMLSVQYESASTNIKIKISNAPIISLETVQGIRPYKTEYIEEQELDITDLRLKINYESGDPDIINVTEDMISGFDSSIIGSQQVTITYLEKYATTYTINIREKKVANISIAEVPDKNLYLLDEIIDFDSLAGGRLHISYDNGFGETKDFQDLFQTQQEIDAALSYRSDTPQKEIVTLTYGGKAVIFDILVLTKKADSFELLSKPSELQIVGTDLSLRGGRVLVFYNNETNETVNMTDEKVTEVKGYDKNTIGEQTITLSFSDIREKYSFTIEVIEATPVALEILLPIKENGQIIKYSQSTTEEKQFAEYYQESYVDLELIEYRLKMDNNSYSAIYTVNQNMFDPNNGSLYLENYGIVNYIFNYFFDNKVLSTNVQINALKKQIKNITVTPPTNNIFYYMEDLVLTGATFTAVFNDGSSFTDNISRQMVSGYNSSQLGKHHVTITYTTDNYGSATSFFEVLIIRKAIKIEFHSIAKSVYVLGEEFEPLGLVMRVYYENYALGDLESQPFGEEWTFINTVFDEVGTHQVIVEYQAVGLKLTTTIPVTVKNDLVSITLIKQVGEQYQPVNSFTDVVAGMPLDLSGMFLECVLENGVEVVPLTANMTDYQRSNLATGSRQINIFYGHLEITASLEVIEKEIASLQLISVPQRKYYKAMVAATIELEDLVMRLYYTNQTSITLDINTLEVQNIDSLEYQIINLQGFVEIITLDITPLDTTLEDGVEFLTKNIEISIENFSVGFDIIVAYKIATAITWDTSDEGEEEVAQPSIMAYQGFEEISFPENASFKIIYNDGEFNEIIDVNSSLDMIEIIGFNYNQSGIQVIDLRVQDIYLSTVIQVRAKDLISIEFHPDNIIPDVTQGMDPDLRNMKIIATYDHGSATEEDDIQEIISLSLGMTNYNKNNGETGTRNVTVTYSYRGVTKQLYFDINVVNKKLKKIGMGTIPKTKYVELDQYDNNGGTIILYYDNNTTVIKSLSEAGSAIFSLNLSQFNNEDFTGFARKQRIDITYTEDEVTCTTSYDIIMHDRLNLQLVFQEVEEYDTATSSYYFWYGEDREIQYNILGYPEHTDLPEQQTLIQMDLEVGINYSYKYINVETGEEFGSWPKDAGEYMIYIHYDADSYINNDRIHNSFVFNQRKIVISPKNIHIAANPITKVYGENNPEFTSIVYAIEYRESAEVVYHTDRVFGYNEDVSVLGDIVYTCVDNNQMSVWKKSSVGQYEINISVTPNRNYNITFEGSEFNITQRRIIIIALSQTKIYGESDPLFTYITAGIIGDDKSGYIEGDNFTGYLLRQSASTNTSVGEYTITRGTLNNNNYEIEFISNTLTITPRKLVLVANSYSKVYGESMPIFRMTATSGYQVGFALNETFSSLGGSPVYSCLDNYSQPVGAQTEVGEYVINSSGYSSNNYDIEFQSGTLTINKRKINVHVVPGQTKVYGEQDGIFEYIVTPVENITESGLYPDDQLDGELSRTAGEDVAGEYYILPGTLNNANYQIETFTQALFNITKRSATIEINVLQKEYDGLLPEILDDDYDVHNSADPNIKDNIVIYFGSTVSKNKGLYLIEFANNDTNHNLSFHSPNGYNFSITPKAVSAEFFNIPYGSLENGEYSGSVYKGSPYYYEARVPQNQICGDDAIEVTIHTAEIIQEATPIYLEKKAVTDVGTYSVKIISLSNDNYALSNYDQTEFTIVPAEIKVFITVPEMSKPYYNNNEIIFDNHIRLVEGEYKTQDYTIVSDIGFIPDIYVYPYYLNDGTELYPKVVIFEKDQNDNYIIDPETGNRIIAGYNIKAVSRNKNYIAILVDELGQPLELDEEEEIVEKDYRLKIIPLMVSFGIDSIYTSKLYNGEAPEIDKSIVTVQHLNKEKLNFIFQRIEEFPIDSPYYEYNVPEFMADYIQDSDCGVYNIIPYSEDPNYDVMLSEASSKVYVIRRITLTDLDFDPLYKQYDGLQPSLDGSNLRSMNFVGDKADIRFDLLFGDVPHFNVGYYSFNVQFKFPMQNPEYHAEYSLYLDYNHRFNSSSLLVFNNRYNIVPREVYVKMIEEEDITWKRYNGLEGALVFEEPGNISSNPTDIKFRYGYEVFDAIGLDKLNNVNNTKISDVIKAEGGQLRLYDNTIATPDNPVAVMIDYLSKNQNNVPINTNFVIAQHPESDFTFKIQRQVVRFYIAQTTKIYGEEIYTSDYNFTIIPGDNYKVIRPLGYGYDTALFGIGDIPNSNIDYVFQLENFIPIINGYTDNKTNTGIYDIICDGLNKTTIEGVEFIQIGREYLLQFINEEIVETDNKLVIERRELPVRYANVNNNTIQKVYGDSIENIIFGYENDDPEDAYAHGLMAGDIDTIISPEYVYNTPSGDYVEQVGIIELDDIVELAWTQGDNTNYYFTYDVFYDSMLGQYINPELEIIKAFITIELVPAAQSVIQATYGEMPATDTYYIQTRRNTNRNTLNYWPTIEEDWSFIEDWQLIDNILDTIQFKNIYGHVLYAETVEIGGQMVTFNTTSIDVDLSSSNLGEVIFVDFKKKVRWEDNSIIAHEISPEMVYRATIRRTDIYGDEYDYLLEIPLESSDIINYQVKFPKTDYLVHQRQIDISLKNSYDDVVGQNAEFNILWNEALSLITREMILLKIYGTKENILLSYFDKKQIVQQIDSDVEKLVLTRKGKSYFLTELSIEHDEANINEKFALLTPQQKATVINNYDFSEPSGSSEYNGLSDEQIILKRQGKEYFLLTLGVDYNQTNIDSIYNNLSIEQKTNVITTFMNANESYVYSDEYSLLTEGQINYVYDVLFTQQDINILYSQQNLSEQDLAQIHAQIISELDNDQQRLVFDYIFDTSALVYGDVIGVGSSYAIDTTNVELDYNPQVSEDKIIKAKGLVSMDYIFNYIESDINIYNYVVGIGITNNEIPNTMIKSVSQQEQMDFLIRVSYANGDVDYLSFADPSIKYSTNNIDYDFGFDYLSSPIDTDLMYINQNVRIRYEEQFFGYKDNIIDSQNFSIRIMKDGDDELLMNAQSFLSQSSDDVNIGDKVDANYTYYMSNDALQINTYTFDILETNFRLMPKENVANYYFELIINGNEQLTDYWALRFSYGTVEQVGLRCINSGLERYNITASKPGELDIFDGRTHKITVYIDKLGTRQSDTTGYKLIVVIDGSYYFYFNDLAKAYPPKNSSVAGFEGNNCFVWLSSFKVYGMGLESSIATEILPSSLTDQNSFISHSYKIVRGSTAVEINLKALVKHFTFDSSSYKPLINSNDRDYFVYQFILDGVDVSSQVSLPVGAYMLEVQLYHPDTNQYLDNIYMYLQVTDDYTYEEQYSGGTIKKPYMSQPVTYYGYSYDAQNDLQILYPSENSISALNYKNYSYLKSVFELDTATFGSGVTNPDIGYDPGSHFLPYDPVEWNCPYNAAFILKTSDTNYDLRDPERDVYGIGIYVRYDGQDYYTRTYVRLGEALYYTDERSDIIWSSQYRTIIEAVFDEETGNIIIYIRNGDTVNEIRFMNGVILSGEPIDVSMLLPIITHPLSTSVIKVRNTRIKLYQMESGFKKLYHNNYINADTGEFIIRTDNQEFSAGTNLFFDNGSGSAMVSHYNNYSINFKINSFDNASYVNGQDYFRFLIGTNHSYDNNYDNRGIFIGYKKIEFAEEDVYALYFGLYKYNGFTLTYFKEQYLCATTVMDGISYQQAITDLLQGGEHQLSIQLNRQPGDIITIYDGSLYNHIVRNNAQGNQVYSINVFLDGVDVGTGYLPVSNNLSDWRDRDGATDKDFARGIGYDGSFLAHNLYPGLQTLYTDMQVNYFTVA